MLKRILAALVLSLALGAALVYSVTAYAVVTTTTRSRTVTGNGGTSYTFTFPVLSTAHVKVTRTVIATGVGTVLTNGGSCANCYNVTLSGAGSSGGTVVTVTAVAATHTLLIERVTPVTQPTPYTTQGPFRPKTHEDGYDRLTMIAQELSASAISGGDAAAAVATHAGEADPHTGYLKLLGRSGGQIAYGGTGGGESLQLISNSSVAPSKILLGSAGTELVVDDWNNTVGIGTATPGSVYKLNVAGSGVFSGHVAAPVFAYGNGAGLTLSVRSSFSAADGFVAIGRGSELTVDEATDRVGINDATPSYSLDVNGTGRFVGALSADTSLTTPAAYGSGGQLYLYGGSAASEDVWITPTSHGTKGSIYFGTTNTNTFDDVNDFWGIGTATPTVALDVRGAVIERQTTRLAGNTSVDVTDCGGYIFDSTNGTTITLTGVSTTYDGCEVTVVNIGTAGATGITIDATAVAGKIYGVCGAKTYAATATAVNTGATSDPGDWMKLVGLYGTGIDAWVVVGCGGTWN